MIRMIAAAARAPTCLRAGQSPVDVFSILHVLKVVARSQGRGYGGGQIDVVFLPPGPWKLVRTFKLLLETGMRALEDLKIGDRRKFVLCIH